MTNRATNSRACERSFTSLHAFPVRCILNLEGTNFSGPVWDISSKNCSAVFEKNKGPSTPQIEYYIESKTPVILTLSDTLGAIDRVTALVRRYCDVSDIAYLIAFEFFEPLEEQFNNYYAHTA